MRVVFLAVDDEFAGLMQKPLYDRHPHWVVGSVVSTSVLRDKTAPKAALFIVKRSGVVYLAEMARMKIVRKLVSRTDMTFPSDLSRRHGVEEHRTRNINSEPSVAKLHAWAPDVVVSTNFSQYVGGRVRRIPSVGAWNLHKSYLPHYRGMAPSFYALLEGAPWAGATLHVLSEKFDTGDILTQVRVPIRADDTVYALNRRTAEAGGRLFADFLQDFDPSRVRPIPQPPGEWRSYSYPTRADLRAFRRRGLRF